jgi:hypothetical protein
MTKHREGDEQQEQGGDISGGLILNGRESSANGAEPERAGEGVTRLERTLIETGAEISQLPPYNMDMAFNHAVLCQVGLPRSKVDGDKFMRKSGSAWVLVQAGCIDEGKGPVPQPIPYGVMPRLALAWMSTFAVRNKTQIIPIGKNACEFLKLLGVETTGRRYAELRRQINALAACRIQLGFKGMTYSSQPVLQFEALKPKNGHKSSNWPGTMVLSKEYYDTLTKNAVPLDGRAIHALRGSALALDVYAWLAHRLHRIQGRGVILHWKALRLQFAQEYKGKEHDKDFKKAFLQVLKKVLAVYPQANVKPIYGGLLLNGSPPPVPYK